MRGRVIHVGEDNWHRLLVLRRAGLSVDECREITELPELLKTGTTPNAVLVAASHFDPAPATEIIRRSTRCPVILFATSPVVLASREYDLVVPALTNPEEWLAAIQELISSSERLCSASQALNETSARLIRESRNRTDESKKRLNS